MALGSYPDMELADARKAARAKRTLVDAGRDPLLEKQSEIEAQLKASAAKKARGKFKELAEDWYETEIAGGHLKHPAVPRRYLDKYMLPEFGSTVPADVTPAMAARLLARVGKKAPTAANDLLRYMRRVFGFAVRRRLMASSPVAAILKYVRDTYIVRIWDRNSIPRRTPPISSSTACPWLRGKVC